jgi:hypothetical protein
MAIIAGLRLAAIAWRLELPVFRLHDADDGARHDVDAEREGTMPPRSSPPPPPRDRT